LASATSKIFRVTEYAKRGGGDSDLKPCFHQTQTIHISPSLTSPERLRSATTVAEPWLELATSSIISNCSSLDPECGRLARLERGSNREGEGKKSRSVETTAPDLLHHTKHLCRSVTGIGLLHRRSFHDPQTDGTLGSQVHQVHRASSFPLLHSPRAYFGSNNLSAMSMCPTNWKNRV